MIHFRVRFERLAGALGRLQARSALVRAAWLALLCPLVGAVWALSGAGAPPFWVWWALAAGLFVAAVWRLRRHVPAPTLGRQLDRRFGLDDLLVTAMEVDRRGPRSAVEARVLDDAASAVVALGRGSAVDARVVRREAETLVAVLLLLTGTWLLSGVLALRPSPTPWPPLPEVAVGGGGPGASGGSGAADGSRAPGLQAAAGALGDHAATLGMAAALRQGDPAAAARAARALADQAPDLSAAGRAELAEVLNAAARAAGPTEPELAAAMAAVAQALTDEAARAPRAVERLAAALDQRAISVGAGRGPGTVTPAARQGPPAERLLAGATPVALATVPGGRAAGAGSGRGQGLPAGGAAAEAAPVWGGAPSARRSPALGGDPLVVPSDARELVRRYFARQGAP